jgi:hypothetical protein
VVASELEVSPFTTVVVAPPLAIVGPVGAGTNDPATVVVGPAWPVEVVGFVAPAELVVAVDGDVDGDVEEPAATVVVEACDGETELAPLDVVCALTVPATPMTPPLTSRPTTPRHDTVKRDVR